MENHQKMLPYHQRKRHKISGIAYFVSSQVVSKNNESVEQMFKMLSQNTCSTDSLALDKNCELAKYAAHFTANVTFSYVDVYCTHIPLFPWDAYIIKVYKHVRLWLIRPTLSWIVVIKIVKISNNVAVV